MPKKNPPAPRKRRFAAMTPQRRKEIASMGGKEAHLSKRAHTFSSAEAREAGRKGGLAKAARVA